jgi:hypothetical protein
VIAQEKKTQKTLAIRSVCGSNVDQRTFAVAGIKFCETTLQVI